MENLTNNETNASDGGERRLPDGLIDELKKGLTKYPENERPTIIIVGQDETLINNALMLHFKSHDLDVKVITPAEAENLEMGIERGISMVKVKKEEFKLHTIDTLKDCVVRAEPTHVNPATRHFKRRRF